MGVRRAIRPRELRELRHRLARAIDEIKDLRAELDQLKAWRVVAHSKIQDHEARLDALENP